MNYISIIITALLIFPIVAFFITLPYIIYNYNKYGSILLIRTILIYLFILYLLSAYFLIILPLPSFEYASKLTTQVQLIPFRLLFEIINAISHSTSFIDILKNAYVYQTIYNFLLTIPFAIFLRYYLKCNLKKIVLYTFLLSLFFEITQLTGLYYIYPSAYRLFDVDDLIVNTIGGMFGYLVTPIFTKLLPTRNELDLKAYKKGTKVSSTRRIVTFIIDMVLVFILFLIELIIDHIYNLTYDYYIYFFIAIFVMLNIIPFITRGQTIGYKITNIIVTNKDQEKVKRYKLLIRNIIFSYIYIPMMYYLYWLFKYISDNIGYSLHLPVVYVLIAILSGAFIIVRNFILHKPFLYEIITKTKVISTIEIPDINK